MKHLKLTFSDIMQSKILYYDEEVEEADMGNNFIGGAVERAMNFADKVNLLSENGAKTVLVPMENLSEISTLPTSILGKTDLPFYGNSQMLLQKAVLGE